MPESQSVSLDKMKKKSAPDWFPKQKRRKVCKQEMSSDPFLNDFWTPYYENEDEIMDACMDYLMDHPCGDILDADLEKDVKELTHFCEETKKFFAKFEESEGLSLAELLIMRGLLCI